MRDVAERQAIAMIDSASWIEVWPGRIVELHHPVKVSPVGYVDSPQAVVAPTLEVGLQALDVEATEDLVGRLRRQMREPEPTL